MQHITGPKWASPPLSEIVSGFPAIADWSPAIGCVYLAAMGGADGSRARRQRIGAMAIIATGAFFMWRGIATLPLGTIDNPGPAAMPLLLAGLLILFALWGLNADRSGLIESGEGEADAEPGAGIHAVLIVAAIVVAAAAFSHLGYRLTILGLLLFFLGVVERKPIVTVLLVSFALSFGSHALFVHVLRIPLPSGPLGL